MDIKKYNCDINSMHMNSSYGIMLNWCRNNTVVLDVGCSRGYFGEALSKYKSCRCFGIEYDRERREEAKARGVYEELTADDLNTPDERTFAGWKNKFDYIILGDVLEHLLSPLSALSALKQCIARGGELLISLPNVAHASIKAGLLLNQFRYTEEGFLDRTHLHFFTAENVADLLSDAQLEIIEATGTVMGFKGFTDGEEFYSLPIPVLMNIFQNVHSFVYQYVCRTVPSSRLPDELRQNNRRKLDFDFEALPLARKHAEMLIRQLRDNLSVKASTYTMVQNPSSGICIHIP